MEVDKEKFQPIEEVRMPNDQKEFLVNDCRIKYAYQDGDDWYIKKDG